MKRLALILFVAAFALAQAPIRHGDLVVMADRQDSVGPARHLSGHVTFETDAMIVRADQADYNENTREIIAQGEVRVNLK